MPGSRSRSGTSLLPAPSTATGTGRSGRGCAWPASAPPAAGAARLMRENKFAGAVAIRRPARPAQPRRRHRPRDDRRLAGHRPDCRLAGPGKARAPCPWRSSTRAPSASASVSPAGPPASRRSSRCARARGPLWRLRRGQRSRGQPQPAGRCATTMAASACRRPPPRTNEPRLLGTESSPASVRAPEGKGCAERFIRALKENLPWVRGFDSTEELGQALLDFRGTRSSPRLIARRGFQTPSAVRAKQLPTAAPAA
jgi:hypothetical protein